MRLNYLIVAFCILISSCKKDTPTVKEEKPFFINPSEGVFIINEGGFRSNNSSISYYNFSNGTVTGDLFDAANRRPLGDVFQSMEVINDKAYLVINYSGKIEIVDPHTLKSLGTIRGLTSPRYFVAVDSSKAYVSDFKSNHISVLDLNANVKVKEIPCEGWTEQMVVLDKKVYVTNISKGYVYVIDTNTDLLVDSIKVGPAPNSIVKDKNNKLWILGGNSYTKQPGTLSKVDPISTDIELQINFAEGINPSNLEINGTLDALYYFNNGVYKLSIDDETPPVAPIILEGDLSFYGLGIDPKNENIYVSNGLDFVQEGKVYIYNNSGNLTKSFSAGIIPRDFYFY